MKKDLFLACFLSCCFFFGSFIPLTESLVAFRKLSFYLIYPTVNSLEQVLTHGPRLPKFWKEVLESRRENRDLKELILKERLAQFQTGLLGARDENIERQGNIAAKGVQEFGNRKINFKTARVRYRGGSALEWVSRVCVEPIAGGVEEGHPVVVYSPSLERFVYAGQTLSPRENFGPFPCVELITNQGFSLLANTGVSQEQGLLRGKGRADEIEFEYLPTDSLIQAGERLFTSPASVIAPSGIAIGEVVSFEKPKSGSLFGKAQVKPFVDLARLEEVVLVFWRPAW